MTRPLSAAKARAVIEAATLVKAPSWSEDRRWLVMSDDTVLVVVTPSYGGVSRSGRNGWLWWLAQGAPVRHGPHPTREQAAVAGLGAWERWATGKPAT
jgi:hypothetical protein